MAPFGGEEDTQTLRIGPLGEWHDADGQESSGASRVYKPSESNSLVSWLIGRKHTVGSTASGKGADAAAAAAPGGAADAPPPPPPHARPSAKDVKDIGRTVAFTASDVRREGTLWKLGSWVKNWKARHFILRKDTGRLSYYSSSESLKLLGEIWLGSKAKVWTYADGGKAARLATPPGRKAAPQPPAEAMARCFGVLCERTSTVMLLRASSAAEAAEWARDVKLQIERMRGQMSERRKSSASHQSAELESLFGPLDEDGGGADEEEDDDSDDDDDGDSGGDSGGDSDAEGGVTRPLMLRRLPASPPVPPEVAPANARPLPPADDTVFAYHLSVQLIGVCEADAKVFVTASTGTLASLEAAAAEVDAAGLGASGSSSSASRGSLMGSGDGARRRLSLSGLRTSMSGGKAKSWSAKGALAKAVAAEAAAEGDAAAAEAAYRASVVLEHAVAATAWKETCCTECVKAGDPGTFDKALLGAGVIALRRQFAVCLPRPDKGAQHVLLAVHKTNGKQEFADGATHPRLALAVVPAAALRGRAPLRIKLHLCNALEGTGAPLSRLCGYVGLIPLRDRLQFERDAVCRTSLGQRPTYADAHFLVRTAHGRAIFAKESLGVSQFACSVPAALLALLRLERGPLIKRALESGRLAHSSAQRLLGIKQTEHDKAHDAAQNPPAPEAASALEAHFSALKSELKVTVARAKGLAKALRVVEAAEDLQANRTESEALVRKLLGARAAGLSEAPVPAHYQKTVVHPVLGGAELRRSTSKKEKLKQCMPTNLNVQVLHAVQLGASAMLAGVGAGAGRARWQDAESGHLTMPTVTFGCTSSHLLGHKHGGLRALLRQRYPADAVALADEKPETTRLRASRTRARRAKDLHRDGGCLPAMVEVCAAAAKDPGVHLPMATAGAGWEASLQLSERTDHVVSQAIAVACTQLHALVLAAEAGSVGHYATLRRCLSCGYLISVQSLLSSTGDEQSMIEDMSVAVEWLETCAIRLVTASEAEAATEADAATDAVPVGECDGIWVRRQGGDAGGGLVVDVLVGDRAAAVVRQALESMRSANLILSDKEAVLRVEEANRSVGPPASGHSLVACLPLYATMFTQGVNETQTLANSLGKHSLQDNINWENLEKLQHYLAMFEAIAQADATAADHGGGGGRGDGGGDADGDGDGSAAAAAADDEAYDEARKSRSCLGQGVELAAVRAEAARWRASLAEAWTSIDNLKGMKNVQILLATADISRAVAGLHSICCKSGKDRTSMSVTLEQTQVICDWFRVAHGRRIVKILRRFGARRGNVIANTGATKYAFNPIQVRMLPHCLRPPAGTFSATVIT